MPVFASEKFPVFVIYHGLLKQRVKSLALVIDYYHQAGDNTSRLKIIIIIIISYDMPRKVSQFVLTMCTHHVLINFKNLDKSTVLRAIKRICV
jgi:hypothetical protein